MQPVVWHLIDQQHTFCKKRGRKQQQKTNEPRLPACRHLAQTHHVNFMTTACYGCQFFALSRIHWDIHKSLWHSSFILLFLSLFDGVNERFREMLNSMGLVRWWDRQWRAGERLGADWQADRQPMAANTAREGGADGLLPRWHGPAEFCLICRCKRDLGAPTDAC